MGATCVLKKVRKYEFKLCSHSIAYDSQWCMFIMEGDNNRALTTFTK